MINNNNVTPSSGICNPAKNSTRRKNGAKLHPFFELENKRVCNFSLKYLIFGRNY